MENSTLSFHICLVSFCCLMGLAKTSWTILNKREEDAYPFVVGSGNEWLSPIQYNVCWVTVLQPFFFFWCLLMPIFLHFYHERMLCFSKWFLQLSLEAVYILHSVDMMQCGPLWSHACLSGSLGMSLVRYPSSLLLWSSLRSTVVSVRSWGQCFS